MNRFWFKASWLQAWLESTLFAVLLLRLLFGSAAQMDTVALNSMVFFSSAMVYLWGALRMRLVQKQGWMRAGAEILHWLFYCIGLPATLALFFQLFGWFDLLGRYATGNGAFSMLALIGFGSVIILPARLFAYLLRRWKQIRETRMAYAVTHIALLSSLIAALGVMLIFSLRELQQNGFAFQPAAGTDWLPAAFQWLGGWVLPKLSLFFLYSLAGLAVLGPAVFWLSYRLAQRSTRRLEELSLAAGALGEGSPPFLVQVSGEDEVAQLQQSFNRMAVQLEESMASLSAERDRANGLLRARRELFANVSHELRTPIATIDASLETHLRDVSQLSTEAAQEKIDAIAWQVAQLRVLLNDLFLLARTEVDRLEIHPQMVQVALLVREVVNSYAPLAWKRGSLQLISRVDENLPPLWVDPVRLEQVLGNLIRNAVRWTRPGGVIALFAYQDDDRICLDVHDSGVGIRSDEMDQIWEPFHQGVPGEDHAGLGLALVRELTERMGGDVHAESKPGEGTCFTISFPITETKN